MDDDLHGPPSRRQYPSLLRCLFGTLIVKAYAALSVLEMWHARRPWITRLLIPVTVMVVWWSYMADPNAALLRPVSTLPPAGCTSLLASRQYDGGAAHLESSRTASAHSLSEALLLAAGESKRVLLAPTNSGYGALASNWLKHVGTLRPPLPNHVVVALDKAEGTRLAAGGANSFYDPAG